MSLLRELPQADVAVFDAFVVPRYLSAFGAMVSQVLLPSEGAVIASLGCRTGFQERAMAGAMRGMAAIGFDSSKAALDIARARAPQVSGTRFEYRLAEDIPIDSAGAEFSHVVCVHPIVDAEGRPDLFDEMFRLLVPGGQALVALPMRGSSQELIDLMREFALKHDSVRMANLLESNLGNRPTAEMLCEQLEGAGFCDVDINVQPMVLSFASGRDFFGDPVCRLMLVPDLVQLIPGEDPTDLLRYVYNAINLYWSETPFELGVNIGCASARRPF